jgi:hypothetical protein
LAKKSDGINILEKECLTWRDCSLLKGNDKSVNRFAPANDGGVRTLSLAMALVFGCISKKTALGCISKKK